MLIPALEWHHPIEANTCDYCASLHSAYEGTLVGLGSPEYSEISGPYHPSCIFEWIFRLVPASELGTPVLGIIDSLPAESDTWGIASKVIWPIAVFAAMINKARDKEVPAPDESYFETGFSPSLIEDAALYIRNALREGKKTPDAIKEYVRMKWGINGEIAIEETGI